ncbi:MAG: zinc ribbon domain-containing protein [Candidatus Jordarchaeum sp.]|uniref:zinc ribbon domain-containing protein n=1 Tax=Candidatus Jordarchaeum sp. TaxID=2823881 RepID=UPI00404A5AF8
MLEDVKGGRTSKRLKTLYRKRRRRFRDHVNSLVSDFVSRCWREGVSEIVCGDLREVRKQANFSKKSNSLIHNFWSHGYVLRRIKEKAEEYGIRVTTVEERGASSQCPRCGSKHMVRKGRLFRCLNCGLEAHRDAVGCVNIGLAQGEPIPAGVINRAVTRPTLLCVP